jgi:hypothetical protein
MILPITTKESVEIPREELAFAFIDAEDGRLKVKKHDSLIEFDNSLDDYNLLNLCDYTSFEVYAHDYEISAGITLEILGGKTFEAIPSGLTHNMEIKLRNYSKSNDVIIDWGDGTYKAVKDLVSGSDVVDDFNTFGFYNKNIEKLESTLKISHTYRENGKYIVKIFGKDYLNVSTSDIKTSLICRILDKDLPIASHLISLRNFAQNSPRLINVNLPTGFSVANVTDWSGFVKGCSNLRSFKGFANAITTVKTMAEMFKNCPILQENDLTLPISIYDKDGLKEFCKNCFKVNLDQLFSTGSLTTISTLNMEESFYGVKLFSNENTIPDDKLWNSKNITWGSFTSAFANIGSALRSKIPLSWGGGGLNSLINKTTEENVRDEINTYTNRNLPSIVSGYIERNVNVVLETRVSELVSSEISLNMNQIVSSMIDESVTEQYAKISGQLNELESGLLGKASNETVSSVVSSFNNAISGCALVSDVQAMASRIEMVSSNLNTSFNSKLTQEETHYYPSTGDELTAIANGILSGTLNKGVIHLAAKEYEIKESLKLCSKCSLIGSNQGITIITFNPPASYDFEIDEKYKINPSSYSYYALTYRFPVNRFSAILASENDKIKNMAKCSNKAIIHLCGDPNSEGEVGFINISDITINVKSSIKQGAANCPDYGILGNVHTKLSTFERIWINAGYLDTTNNSRVDQLKVGIFFPYCWMTKINGCRVHFGECGFAINASTSMQYTSNYSSNALFCGHFLYDIKYSEISSCAVDGLNPTKINYIFGYAYKISNIYGTRIHACGAEKCHGSYMFIESIMCSEISNCMNIEMETVATSVSSRNINNIYSVMYGGTTPADETAFNNLKIGENDGYEFFTMTPFISLAGRCACSKINGLLALNVKPYTASTDANIKEAIKRYSYDVYTTPLYSGTNMEINNLCYFFNSSPGSDTRIYGYFETMKNSLPTEVVITKI